jgi:hypothetical protein
MRAILGCPCQRRRFQNLLHDANSPIRIPLPPHPDIHVAPPICLTQPPVLGGEPKIFAPQKCVATSSFRNLCNEWIAQPAQRPQNDSKEPGPTVDLSSNLPPSPHRQTSVRFAPPNAPTRFRFPVPVVEFLFQNILYELCSCGKCCEGAVEL